MLYIKSIKDEMQKKQAQFLICLAWLLKTEEKFGLREILSFKIYDRIRKLSNDRKK